MHFLYISLGLSERSLGYRCEPFFRDTVLVHGKETVDVGVVPLDDGMWMLHCHILEHAEAGMMTMIHVSPP